MPKALKEFPKAKRTGRSPVHPYDDWFEQAAKGEGIQLIKGEDFDSDIKTMRHNLYRTSKSRNLTVETVTIIDGNTEALGLRVVKATPKANK